MKSMQDKPMIVDRRTPRCVVTPTRMEHEQMLEEAKDLRPVRFDIRQGFFTSSGDNATMHIFLSDGKLTFVVVEPDGSTHSPDRGMMLIRHMVRGSMQYAFGSVRARRMMESLMPNCYRMVWLREGNGCAGDQTS